LNVRPLHFCDVTVQGELWPVFGWAIDAPAGTILVDTGMVESTPELDAEWGPVLLPWPLDEQPVAVINTHLHFDHCGGNRRFAGTPIHVQARELADGISGETYVNEWIDFAGATYVEHDGEAEVLPGIRLLPTPGHTEGHQSVLVDTADGLVVLGGDVAYTFRELGKGATEGQRRVLELGALTWLAHVELPKVPRPTV
jgi:N-acyl homoserine lactone hydrolase